MTKDQIAAEIKAFPVVLERKLPRPITSSSASWLEWESVLNGARSNLATPAATTYGLPIYNPATGYHVRNPERNEFWDHPELLKFVCYEGKARCPWPDRPAHIKARLDYLHWWLAFLDLRGTPEPHWQEERLRSESEFNSLFNYCGRPKHRIFPRRGGKVNKK